MEKGKTNTLNQNTGFHRQLSSPESNSPPGHIKPETGVDSGGTEEPVGGKAG